MNLPTTNPERIAGYPVRRELRAGETFLATAPPNRPVVLKRLDDDCLFDGELHPSVMDRLGRVREVAHAGIANLYGVERDPQGQAWLIWQHVEGQTLEESLGGQPSLPPEARERVARELVFAVEALHARGLVHGAIHARNIVLGPAGRVCLTHVSPLLHHDPTLDRDAVIWLADRMGVTLEPTLIARLGAGAVMPASPGPEADPTLRWRTLLGALLIALIGAGAAWLLHRLGSV